MSDVKFVNAAYYFNYRSHYGKTPASLNYNCITHVFYAFAQVSADGHISLSDHEADALMPVDDARGCLGSLIALKQKHEHLRVLLSVGGGGKASTHFAVAASSAVTRDNFAQSAKGIIETCGLDGLDGTSLVRKKKCSKITGKVDWEHPSSAEQGRDFLSLLATIRIHLPDERYLLTAALPPGYWALRWIDLYKASDYLDFLNIMAYDFAGPWTELTAHHAALFSENNPDQPSGDAAITYVLSRRFPASKILLGIPVYGRLFPGADGPGKLWHRVEGEEHTYPYNVLLGGPGELVDKECVAACCGDFPDRLGWISYDNPETVTRKAKWVKEKGLGGLFYWDATGDAPPGPRSLISTGFKALHES